MTPRLLVLAALAGLTACSGSSAPTPPSPAPAASPLASPAPSPSPSDQPPSPSPTPVTPPTPSPTVISLPRCVTAQLRLSVRDADSGAGQSHQQVILTNRGARCTLRGYPGVSFVDSGGRTLGSPADESPGTARQVALAPGSAAVAVLTYSNAGAFPESSCRPQQAARLRVYPPGDRDSLLVGDPVLVCSAQGTKQLRIGPIAAG